MAAAIDESFFSRIPLLPECRGRRSAQKRLPDFIGSAGQIEHFVRFHPTEQSGALAQTPRNAASSSKLRRVSSALFGASR